MTATKSRTSDMLVSHNSHSNVKRAACHDGNGIFGYVCVDDMSRCETRENFFISHKDVLKPKQLSCTKRIYVTPSCACGIDLLAFERAAGCVSIVAAHAAVTNEALACYWRLSLIASVFISQK